MRLLTRALPVVSLMFLSLGAYAQGNGYVKAKVDPGRAGVFVDGKYVGPAANFGMARKYSVAVGEHEIKLVEPRYEEITTKVTVAAGKTSVISEKMKALPLIKPPYGRLRTITPDKYAAVYINDKFYGHAGEFNNPLQGLLLPPGEYSVRVVPPSGAPHEEKIKIEADKTVIVRAK
jgi:PEGA domain